MSPRTPSAGSCSSRPGRSSSIGKLMTSVGPGRSIHCTCRTSIAGSSTSLIHRSACGWTFISRITYFAQATSSISSSETSLSLRTSMLTAFYRLVLDDATLDGAVPDGAVLVGTLVSSCLLYTSDAADDLLCVDL